MKNTRSGIVGVGILVACAIVALLAQPACAEIQANPPLAQKPVSMISIVHPPDARPLVVAAARELAAGLAKLYPGESFQVTKGTPAKKAKAVIHVGAQKKPGAQTRPHAEQMLAPEEYCVETLKFEGARSGRIVGGDSRGVIYGVYALLEKLGYGYYLSFNVTPEPKKEAFSFNGWNLRDRPLVPTRLVLNWHNFLSGCSTWEVKHWAQWTNQLQKMRYNTVMVHAYGNSPMAGFQFEGLDKPVGYLSSTRVGRDWSTMHVNDVRRLVGGEVFNDPVFGCRAAIDGTDRQRTDAAQQMMRQVFAHIDSREMDVLFALDVDTITANPQPLILKLPEHARYQTQSFAMPNMGQPGGPVWLVNPDTPEGYAFYKAQAQGLLTAYPQLKGLVLWFRIQRTALMGVGLEELPPEWQKEYKAEIEKKPAVESAWRSVGIFALGKVVRAHQRALSELGHKDVEVAIGSWGFDLLPAADHFMPEGVRFLPLDLGIMANKSWFDVPERKSAIARYAATREVIPIAWAQHDDGEYIGPPYVPFENFHKRLGEMRCDKSGFGIIHWTTRPLDIYFKSLQHQVSQSTKNQDIKTTIRQTAVDMFGPEQAEPMAKYLHLWLTGQKRIGRDTTDFLIDHELTGIKQVRAGCAKRIKLLDKVDRKKLSSKARQRVEYFRRLERFILSIHENDILYNKARRHHAAGDIAAARTAMRRADPAGVIRLYAQMVRLGDLTRGEQGLVVSLNTRWLAHYTRLCQQLGLEPIRYNFAPTSHDPLAQVRGVFTYYLDPRRRSWFVQGQEETGVPAYGDLAGRVQEPVPTGVPTEWGVCRSGLDSGKPFSFEIRPIMLRDNRDKFYKKPPVVPGGKYRLVLWFGRPKGVTANSHVFEIAIETNDSESPIIRKIDLFTATNTAPNMARETFQLELTRPGYVKVRLTPVNGNASISGAELSPIRE